MPSAQGQGITSWLDHIMYVSFTYSQSPLSIYFFWKCHTNKGIYRSKGNKDPRDPFLHCSTPLRIQLETFLLPPCLLQDFSYLASFLLEFLHFQTNLSQFQKVNDLEQLQTIPSTCQFGTFLPPLNLKLWQWHISAFLVVNSSTFSSYA